MSDAEWTEKSIFVCSHYPKLGFSTCPMKHRLWSATTAYPWRSIGGGIYCFPGRGRCTYRLELHLPVRTGAACAVAPARWCPNPLSHVREHWPGWCWLVSGYWNLIMAAKYGWLLADLNATQSRRTSQSYFALTHNETGARRTNLMIYVKGAQSSQQDLRG
jgi:hypothetical protein